MLRECDRRTAEHFGILDRSEQLRIDLMESEDWIWQNWNLPAKRRRLLDI